MRPRTLRAALAAAACLGLAGIVAASQDLPADGHRDPLSRFMRRKLDHAQGVLSGLTTLDLVSVGEHADKLGLLCIDEEWDQVQSPEYAERSLAFRRTIAALARAARDDKLERAQLAYVDLVGQCFTCHQYVRDR